MNETRNYDDYDNLDTKLLKENLYQKSCMFSNVDNDKTQKTLLRIINTRINIHTPKPKVNSKQVKRMS